MASIEFLYNGKKNIIQCNLNEKIKEMCQKFINKTGINKNNIYFLYDGKAGTQFNENLTFEEMANTEDKKRKIMKILVMENEPEPKPKDEDIIKSKDIICPECGEISKMDIIDYKIILFDCKNGHKIENILLDQFENTQNVDIEQK